jgi:hypothetical protein
MHREVDDMAVLFNSKGLGLKDKKSSPFIKGRDGSGPGYRGSRPNIEIALQKFSPNKVSSMRVRHDMPAEENASNETVEEVQFLSL